jgi:hypothetical protein
VVVCEAFAQDAGYESYADYLAAEIRRSGGLAALGGLALFCWGLWKCTSRDSRSESPRSGKSFAEPFCAGRTL